MVECLTRDRGAAGSSLTGITALWSLSKTHLVRVQPRKTRPCLTERLLMGRKESNQSNKINQKNLVKSNYQFWALEVIGHRPVNVKRAVIGSKAQHNIFQL